MRKSVQAPHLLAEFIQEQPTYSADFKALVLRLLDQEQDIDRVAQQTLVPTRTLYNWLEAWNQEKKASTNRSDQASGRVATLTPAQGLAFVEYSHTLPEPHFIRPQLVQRLFERTGFGYAQAYLCHLFRQMGLRFYKPRPRSVRRSPEAASRLIDRLQATFDVLQTLGYDLNRVAFGFAVESSSQLSANTARLWSLGKADRVVNTDKSRANTSVFWPYKASIIVSHW